MPDNPIVGYIYSNHPCRKRYVPVYMSIQELRICCGEIPLKEIEKVEVRKADAR